MARPFTLEKCDNRDQIMKQYERMSDQLYSVARHANIIANSYGEGYENHAALAGGFFESVVELINLMEELRGYI